MGKKMASQGDFQDGFLGLLRNLVVPVADRNDDADGKSETDRASASTSSPISTPPRTSRPAPPVTTGDNRPGGWRPARSLLKLRDQVNAVAPHRSTASDGIIGDANHQNRQSDHNPWVADNGVGVVTAIDITHDPARGCDAGLLAGAIAGSRDARVKYVIWNRQISNHLPLSGQPAWAWRPYSGANPHDKHVHISVLPDKTAYDDVSEWALGQGGIAAGGQAGTAVPAPGPAPVLPPHDAGAAIAWGKQVSQDFKAKLVAIANALGVDPSILMAVMAFETGRRFSSSARNPVSGATGLIQFMPGTAAALGTTIAELAAMSEVRQLDYVQKYLQPYAGRMNDVASAYMAVLFPKAVAQPLAFVLFEAPSKAYQQNRGLDADDDGRVTKAEASAKVMQQLTEGMRPENLG